MVSTQISESSVRATPGVPDSQTPGSGTPPLVGRRVGTGALWSALNAATLRVATFLVTLIVARLVAPYEFGVFTVAVTVFTVAMSFAELGVSFAIVREHQRSPQIAPTVFTISLANAAALALAMVVFAPFLARQLGSADAASAIRVLALYVLLSGFSAVPRALMNRDFMQRRRFVVDAAFFVTSTAVMLVLVMLGHPVMGLAISRVAGQLVTVIMIMWMAPERYWPGFRWHEARALLSFGLPLAASNMLILVIANVDFMVVGHMLGARQLGFYNLAFGISGWPVSVFSAVLISVTLPTLSRVRDSPRELTGHLGAGLSAVVSLSFPVCALCSVLAGPLIDTVYGTRWHPASTALIVLSIFGAARTVLTLFSDLTVALGMTRRLMYIQLAWLAALIPAMIFCVGRWGIMGAGIAHAVVVVPVVIPLYLITVRRATTITARTMRDALVRPLVASLAAAAIAYGATLLVNGAVPKLLLGLVLGVLTYWVLARRWLIRLQRDLRERYWNGGPIPRGRHALRQPASGEQSQTVAADLLLRHGTLGASTHAPRSTRGGSLEVRGGQLEVEGSPS